MINLTIGGLCVTKISLAKQVGQKAKGENTEAMRKTGYKIILNIRHQARKKSLKSPYIKMSVKETAN